MTTWHCAAVAALSIVPAVVSAQQAKSRETGSERITGFNIVLVLGETQPSGSAADDGLPAAARRALNDMREFLPYKHYRVLDALWTSCCAPTPNITLAGRLQGVVVAETPGSGNSVVRLMHRPYSFIITAGGTSPSIPVRFVLTADDGLSRRSDERIERERALERQRKLLEAEVETASIQLANAKKRVDVGLDPASSLRPLQDRLNSVQRRLADVNEEAGRAAYGGSRPVIDSSFTMEPGETVVVGTSKLGGDKALIAVVTAVRKGKAAGTQ